MGKLTPDGQWRADYRKAAQERDHAGSQPDLFGGPTVHHQHRRTKQAPSPLARNVVDPPPWCRSVCPVLDPAIKAAMLESAANWLSPGQRVQIVSAPGSIDGRTGRRVGRVGVIWRLCSPAFADHVYVNLDLVGAERSEKVEFLEIRDIEPID